MLNNIRSEKEITEKMLSNICLNKKITETNVE